MTITASYSRAHQAFAEVAAEHGLGAFDVRVLVALQDHGGDAYQGRLADALVCDRAAVRRALRTLAENRLVRRYVGSGPRTETFAALIDAGWQIGNSVIERCRGVAV